MNTPAPVVSAPVFQRRPGRLDPLIAEADRAMQVLSGVAAASRPNPAGPLSAKDAPLLDAAQRKHAAGLMRINHVGEVCAQALYRGQAAVCKDPATRKLLEHAAVEEVDHLAWCAQRVQELGSRTSLLNPLWYAGSFGLGLVAGLAGPARNLGFMAETERQVEEHLDGHLSSLPPPDQRSRRIVEQMKQDEAQHRESAEQGGGVALPAPIRGVMRLMSKVMTATAYRI